MAQPEAKLSRQIMESLRRRGAFVFKVWGSEHMMAGLPDIVGVYKGFFIAIETKMPGKDATTRQKYIHEQIRKAGGRVQVAHGVSEALEIIDACDDAR